MKTISKINTIKISYKLKQCRIKRKISKTQISYALKISPHFISFIESGDWDSLPSGVNGRWMIKAYAEFLEVNMCGITDKYRTEDERTMQEMYRLEDIQFKLRKSQKEKYRRYSQRLKTIPKTMGPRLSQYQVNSLEKQVGKIIKKRNNTLRRFAISFLGVAAILWFAYINKIETERKVVQNYVQTP